MTDVFTDQQIEELLADDTLDEEQGEADHEVPADLIELFEVLEWEEAVKSKRGPIVNVGRSGPGSYVSRAGWGARAPRGRTSLNNPQGCTFHYEGPRMGSFPHSSCATKVRAIQNFHMDGRGWTDIAYNEVVCPHGVIFEGRGADIRSAANGTNAGNGASHAICALTGVGDAHPMELFIGLKAARQILMSAGTGARTWCHRDWKSTSCPGDPIFNWQRAGMPTSGTVPPVDPPVIIPPQTGRCPDEPGRVGHPTIRRGAQGVPVKHLQHFLILSGAPIAGDGDFGPKTEVAVRNHQTWLRDFRDRSVVVDGIVGPRTWQAMHNVVDGLRI